MTEDEIITLARKALKKGALNGKLRQTIVAPESKLSMLKEEGWSVHFVFEEEDRFLNQSLSVEVSRSGKCAVFEPL